MAYFYTKIEDSLWTNFVNGKAQIHQVVPMFLIIRPMKSIQYQAHQEKEH